MLRILCKIPVGVASVLTLVLILWLTLAPRPVGDVDVPLFEGADKVVHAVMFGWFALTLIWDAGKYRCRKGLYPYISALGAVLCASASGITGVAVEFMQRYLTQSRSFELNDIYADFIGAYAMCAFYCSWRLLRSR